MKADLNNRETRALVEIILKAVWRLDKFEEDLRAAGVSFADFGAQVGDSLTNPLFGVLGFPEENVGSSQEGQPVFCRDALVDPLVEYLDSDGDDGDLKTLVEKLEKLRSEIKDMYWGDKVPH